MATKIKTISPTEIRKSKWPLIIGYFGCIHIMHLQLLDKFHHFNILTFNNFKSKIGSQLYTFDERINKLKHFKPQNIYVYSISKHNLKAEDFIQKVLLPLKPNCIIVGTDFKFGSDRKPYTLLQKYFKVETVNYNKVVSTSAISSLLQNKGVERANSFLFEPYHYVSEWVKGNKRGKELGYRTINLLINHKLSVCEGSYVARIKIGRRSHRAVAFVGASKTFKSTKPVIEVHVFNRRMPPRTLVPQRMRRRVRVEFYKYIRGNTQFKNQQSLVNAIKKDINVAKAYFERNK